ncbi:MAG: hypothetical protein MSA34_02885 [Firmicutes bacterium]|nr:hypothetical protein [Bacillota bacterium]MDY5586043.1 hypothetical protein [Eubacteriales bacterium]
MIILDTNAVYRLSGIEKEEKLKIQNLRNYVLSKKCACSMYTIFEILKSNFTFEEKKKVLDFLRSNKIIMEATYEINVQYNRLKSQNIGKEEFYNKLIYIYGDEIINQTYINISFFIIIYVYTSATIFLDHYEQGVTKQKTYFRKHFSIIQRSIDKHIFKIVKSNLYDLLYKNKYTATNIREMLMLVTANLMTYYYELLKKAKLLFENQDKNSYYKVISYFKKLSKQILKDNLCDSIEFDGEYLSVCKLILNEVADGSIDIKNRTKEDVENYLLLKICESIYFVDENMKNEFEEYWLKKMLKSLMIKSAKIKPNSFLDYEIIREFYYGNEYEFIITFDTDMKKILKNVKSCIKFQNSLDLIDSFYN